MERQLNLGPWDAAERVELSTLVLPPYASASSALNQVNGQAMLYLVDQVLRRTILSNATAGEEGMAFGLPAMSPQDAMETLMRPLVMEGTARDVATGYVRHDNTHRARYNTSRTYAIGSTVKEQYEEAAHKWSVGMRQCEHACTPACLHACVRACHRVFFFVAAAKKYDLTSISLAPPPPPP